MNTAVLTVLPWRPLVDLTSLAPRQALISYFIQTAYTPSLGPAAARDGNFFAAFGKLHPTRGFPCVSLLYLGCAAAVFCFFSLGQVIAALVVIRIVVQFLMQHIGVMVLRRTQPTLPRPFRIWLYPLPPLLALAGFTYILLGRPNFQRELVVASAVLAAGTLAYVARKRLTRT